MKTQHIVALSMLAGFGMGAVAITGLNAQGKPGAYAVIDISEITDPEAFKQVGPKAGASAAAAGAISLPAPRTSLRFMATPPAICPYRVRQHRESESLRRYTGTEGS